MTVGEFVSVKWLKKGGADTGGLLAVSGDFGGEVLDSASAAALTQDVAVQRVAASTLAFRRQQESTLLMNTDSGGQLKLTHVWAHTKYKISVQDSSTQVYNQSKLCFTVENKVNIYIYGNLNNKAGVFLYFHYCQKIP